MKVSRRDFLKTSAAAAAAAAIDVNLFPFEAQAGEKWVKTVCRYCGVGCGLMVKVTNGKTVAVKGDTECLANKGLVCVKAFYLHQIHYAKDRLLHPMIKKNGKWTKATWDEAMNLVASKFKEAMEKYGPDSLAYYGSGQALTEETYLASRLFRGFIGTNNVDGNPRLCMASAVGGYLSTFGLDEPAGSYSDIEQCDCFFLIGTNTAEAHPVIYQRIAERKTKNPHVKVIYADPRKTPTNKIVDIHLQFIPGYDLPILHAMAHVIIQEGLTDEDFIANHVNFSDGENPITYDQYKKFLEDFTPEKAAEISGVPAKDIREAALTFAKAKTAMSMWSMGINQRVRGVWANNLIHNLHLLTGKIGVPGSDSFSLTGQPNACGGVREGGGLCHLLPGHRLVANEEHRKDAAAIWGVDPGKIPPKPGYHTVAMFDAMVEGKVKCALILCTSPGVSLPNVGKYRPGMEKTFLVVTEAYHPTKTSELADVVLPAALWAEKEGVYTCSERRAQHLGKAIDPPGEAKPDVEILVDLAKRLGYGDKFPFKTAGEVWAEYIKFTKGRDMDLTGMPYERLKKVHGLQWPCPSVDHPGTSKRYVKGDPLFKGDSRIYFYGKPDGKALIYARQALGPAEPTDKEYPIALTTGRILEHWHTGTMTMKCPALRQAAPTPYVEINPKDAEKWGIESKEMVKVTSRRGTLTLEAKVIDRPREGTVMMPWHWPDEKLTNILTIDAFDPGSKEPEYKICAVRIEKA